MFAPLAFAGTEAAAWNAPIELREEVVAICQELIRFWGSGGKQITRGPAHRNLYLLWVTLVTSPRTKGKQMNNMLLDLFGSRLYAYFNGVGPYATQAA